MSDTSIIIDNRETAIIDYMLATAEASLSITIKPLPIGDFIIKCKASPITIVIERKTWADLVASIHDGRYRDQKSRLLALGSEYKVAYIIEAGATRSVGDFELVRSSIWSMGLRDGMTIVQTTGMEDTVDAILALAKKMSREGFAKSLEITDHVVSEHGLSLSSKKRVTTAKECLVAQLAQVSGVSVKIAMSIADHYESMQVFCQEANESDLANVRINNRRLGVKRAGRILELLGISEKKCQEEFSK